MTVMQEQYELAWEHLRRVSAGEPSDYLDGIDVLPPDKLWMLCVDAKDHLYGRLEYNYGFFRPFGEGNYITAQEAALGFVLKTVGESLSCEFIQKVYALGCSEVSKVDGGKFGLTCFSAGRCPITIGFYSKAGLEEMLSWPFSRIFFFKDKIPVRLTHDNLAIFIDQKLSGEQSGSERERPINELIQEFILEYYSSIQHSTNNNERLRAIAVFAKKLDYLHPFLDGNIRTIRLLILKLLLENKLSPAMMHDPNIIDGFSSDEIVSVIEDGQRYFECVKKGEKVFDSVEFSGMEARFKFHLNVHNYSEKAFFGFLNQVLKNYAVFQKEIVDLVLNDINLWKHFSSEDSLEGKFIFCDLFFLYDATKRFNSDILDSMTSEILSFSKWFNEKERTLEQYQIVSDKLDKLVWPFLPEARVFEEALEKNPNFFKDILIQIKDDFDRGYDAQPHRRGPI